jgi:hypothetical protein
MPQQSSSSSHQPVYRENFPHHSPNPDSMLPQFRQHGRGRHLGVTAYKQWHSDLQTRVVSGSHSGAIAKKGGILLANPRNPRSCIRAAMINQRLRAILDNSPTVSVRLLRHLANIVERMLTPCVMLSDCHLNKHRLINSLWTKVSERGWGSLLWADSSALLNPQNFANTIGKPPWRLWEIPPTRLNLSSGRHLRWAMLPKFSTYKIRIWAMMLNNFHRSRPNGR